MGSQVMENQNECGTDVRSTHCPAAVMKNQEKTTNWELKKMLILLKKNSIKTQAFFLSCDFKCHYKNVKKR